MAEITQTLGFDVSEALTALSQFDKKLADFEKRLQSAATAVERFNQAGAGAGAKGAAANVAAYVTELQKLYQVSGVTTVQQQRAFQSAITSAAEFASKHKISIDQVVQQSRNLGANYTGTANTMADRLAQIDRASKQHLTSAGNRVNGLAVSWQTMVRVVTTQLIVRTMSMLRNAMEESLTAATNFETKLAQIQTIGGPSAGSLQMLAIQVRGLSEEFAKPIEDVAQGYYDILSNQVGSAAEAFLVARESARLSTVAVSSFADAANALSSVINSYHLNAADAADISGKLFAAVDKGRFMLSDIADTIGRVTTLAHQMGVSFDEVLASLATLTISGVKPDEAMTLLSNAMRGLIKPTKAMKEAFQELGVANAEVGVAAYGFQGFLEKLRETTNGTASEIAQLTENIRVGRGVFGLTGAAAEQYTKNLEAIRAAGAEIAGRGAEIIIQTNAQQVQREITQLRNFFINDFALEALKVIKQMLDYFGGLVNIVRSLKDSMLWISGALLTLKGVLAITTALRAVVWTMPGVLTAAGVAAKGLVAALMSIPGVIAITAITAAVVALWRAMDKGKESTANAARYLDEHFNLIRDRENERAAEATIAAKKIQAAQTETVNNAYRQQQRLVADMQKLYDKDVENAVQAQENILDRLRDQLKERLKLIEKVINQLERRQEESARVIEKNRKETSDLRLKDEERYLDRQLGRLDDQAKAVKQLQRARELEGRAAKLTQSLDFEGAEELLKTADQRANAALELGEARLKEAKTVGEQQDALTAISQAEAEVNSILQQRLALREQESKTAQTQAEAAQREIELRRAQLKDAKALVEQISKYEVITKDEKKRAPEEREAARKTALSLTDQLEEVLSRGDVNLEQFLGIQELTSKIRGKFESAITDQPVSLRFAFEEGIEAILAPLKDREVKLKAIITDVEAASGTKFDLIEGFKNIAIKLTQKQAELIEALNKQASLPQEQANLRIDMANISRLAVELANLPNVTKEMKAVLLEQTPVAVGQAAAGQGEELMRLQQRFLAAADEANAQALAATDAERRKSLAETTRQFAELSKVISELLERQAKIAALTEAAPKVQAAIQQNVSAGNMAANSQLFVEFQTQQREAAEGQRIIVQRTKELPQAAAASIPPTVQHIKALTEAAKETEKELSGVAWWLDKINPLSSTNAVRASAASLTGGAIGGKALGGLVSRMKFFESGGVARGTDTIPAMLSPGEFITSAKNTRKFLPQLQAINAGVEPSFETTGGTTYNTTVGDIIIQESKGPRQTGREVMRLIRRETRRGSGRL